MSGRPDKFNLAAVQKSGDVKPPYKIYRGFLDTQVKTIPAKLNISTVTAQTPP